MDTAESIDRLTKGAVSADILLRGLADVVENGSSWAWNCQLAEDTSWCVWAGQSDDGLKHAFDGDEEPPFPWENSSDTRIRMVDQMVREHTKVALLSVKRGNLQAQGTEGLDFMQARNVALTLRWQEAKQIPNARRQRNLFAYWGALYGCSIMGLGWEEREEVALRSITTEDIIRAFLSRFGVEVAEDGSLPEEVSEEAQIYIDTLSQILSDPEESLEWLEQWLGEFFPTASKKTLKAGAQALRDEGKAHLPQKRVVASHPTMQAMVPLRDVFFPLDTESMAEARWVATRRWVTRSEIEANRATWGDAFCDELLKHEGRSCTLGLDNYAGSDGQGRRRWSGSRRRSAFSQNYERSGLYEVFYFYHRSVDADGVGALYRTVCSPHVNLGDGYATAEQEIYDDGTNVPPFESYTIWDDRKTLLECEGIPAWLYTYQFEKKGLRDSRMNVTQLSVLPPVRRHQRDKNLPIILGPDMPIYESVPGSTQWMDPPANRTAMAVDLERTIDREACRFVGAYDAEVPDALTAFSQEFLVDQFTDAYARVLTKVIQLDQLYLPEVMVTRLTGAKGAPFKMSREDIQGQYDVSITFDPRELNMDFSIKKFEALTKIATQLDQNRVTDMNALVKMGYNMIDPNLADLLVQDERVADEREIRATRDAINDIVAGQQPQMEEGINSQLRLSYFSEQLQTNPMLIAIQSNRDDPRAETLAMYGQHLEHMNHNQNVAPMEGALGVKLER